MKQTIKWDLIEKVEYSVMYLSKNQSNKVVVYLKNEKQLTLYTGQLDTTAEEIAYKIKLYRDHYQNQSINP